MQRRHVLTLFLTGGAAFTAEPLSAQDSRGRVGIILNFAANDPETPLRVAAYRQALASAKDIRFEFTGGSSTAAADLARQVVAWSPDVIVGATAPVLRALMRETSTTPIVFVHISDPVGAGIVSNLARPSGNLTGFANMFSALPGKWLSLIKELAPQTATVRAIYNPRTSSWPYENAFEEPAKALGLGVAIGFVSDETTIELEVRRAAESDRSAVVVVPDGFTAMHRNTIIPLVAQYRLPAVYGVSLHPRSGGLLSYGVDEGDLHRRAGQYAELILKGAKPADLPVQQPTKFELVINLRTAKALGLEMPPALLVQADEVIE